MGIFNKIQRDATGHTSKDKIDAAEAAAVGKGAKKVKPKETAKKKVSLKEQVAKDFWGSK